MKANFHKFWSKNLFWKDSESKSTRICIRVQTRLQESKMFSSFLEAQNLDSSRGLVKISASCLSVLTWCKAISPLASWSLKKWCRISMYFVQECWTALFASLIALLLSHNRGIASKWQPKSLNVCLIHKSCAQHTPMATYSASVMDKATEFCFLELHATKERPRNWHVPVALFQSTLQLA
jgi:hypothetical protein